MSGDTVRDKSDIEFESLFGNWIGNNAIINSAKTPATTELLFSYYFYEKPPYPLTDYEISQLNTLAIKLNIGGEQNLELRPYCFICIKRIK